MDKAATGRMGEDYTAEYLTRRGAAILARNWHCRWGELDIVAALGEVVAFVEVKTRRSGAMVTPLQAVTPAKIRRTVLAACAYLEQTGCGLQPRFDVAAVTVSGGAVTGFEYIASAFDADGVLQ